MHCIACDALLSDFESTRKSESTGEYIDLCNHCFETIEEMVYVRERLDLPDSTEYGEQDIED